MADAYSLLWKWANLRPSEIARIPCSTGAIGESPPPPRKHRRKPEIPWSLTVWLDVDMALSKLNESEMRSVVLYVTGKNYRGLPIKVLRKLNRLFRERDLI